MVNGKTVCPFCGGSKIKPFMPWSISDGQNCNHCDKSGMIANSKLKELGLEDMIVETIVEKVARLKRKEKKIFDSVMQSFPATSLMSAYDVALQGGVKFDFYPR